MFVAAWVLSAMAKTQKNVVVRADPNLIADTIRGHFTKLWWPPAQGHGQFNFRGRGFGVAGIIKKKPVMSIDLDAQHDGSTEVQVWMSEWGTMYGMVGLADRVVMKRASLFRKLRALEVPTPSSAA
ncbi:hypothetical protein [Mycobacteroides abscessus]|uniref:hypothetical protein n=2 Tax=Mycobacteriaceae TaxID=1762 RepID=UPI001054AA53|nr:hypothetical protein [Mycobacteroides abscessus]